MDDCLELESDPRLVAAAREFVRSRLTAWEIAELVDSAAVIVSELVTNAVLHARTVIQLRLSLERRSLRIEVFDENPRLPTTSSCPPEATSGRGLALVSALASSWGIEHSDDGKVVWAELGQPGVKDDSEDCLDLSAFGDVEEAIEEIRNSRP